MPADQHFHHIRHTAMLLVSGNTNAFLDAGVDAEIQGSIPHQQHGRALGPTLFPGLSR